MPDPWCTLHLVSLCSVYFAIDVLYSGTRMKYKFHAVFSMQTCIGFQQSVNQKLQSSVPSLNKITHWKMLQDGRGNASEGNLWSHVARRSTIILLGDMRSFLGLWRAQIESQNQIKKWYCHRPWSSHTRVKTCSWKLVRDIFRILDIWQSTSWLQYSWVPLRCLQLAEGVVYLHSQNPIVVHRDLKAWRDMSGIVTYSQVWWINEW